MSLFSESIASLSESQKFAYLQAMGITSWIPKDSVVSLISETEQDNNQPDQSSEPKEIQNIVEVTNLVETEAKTETETDKVSHSEKECAVPSQSQDVVFSVNQYLKVLNWSNQSLKEEGAKNLLIICRHQVDQPANSFARSNSPSLFMIDYINAIKANLEQLDVNINIQMAHLAEAGLSDSSVSMREVLQQAKPDLMLIMGDETVAQLAGEKISVAALRGQAIQLGLQHSALVSYHPYSLIENSSLKPLAMEDISLITKFLSIEGN